MKKRDFIKTTGAMALASMLPSSIWALSKNGRLRTPHIGVNNMGGADLAAISSHDLVDVVALCDVDSNALAKAKKLHPKAATYKDYRVLLKEMKCLLYIFFSIKKLTFGISLIQLDGKRTQPNS